MTLNSPLVSIVVPCFNVAAYLPALVESVLQQSLSDWELILINDGSTDQTAQYLQSLSDPRIQIVQQENLGVSAARNAGIEVCRGDLLVFADGDDLLAPESLKVRAEYLQENPEIGMVEGIICVIADDGQVLRRVVPSYTGPLFPSLLTMNSRYFYSASYMFRRQLLGDVRFRPNMKHSEDLLFLIHLSYYSGIQFGHVLHETYYYRMRAGQATSDMDGTELGYLQLVREARLLPLAPRHLLLYMRYRISRILFLSWLARGRLSRGLKAILMVWSI